MSDYLKADMSPENRIEKFGTVYRALRCMEPSDLSIAATASLRLLLIDSIGEELQKEFIGRWNEEFEELGSSDD